jgi:acetylornithine deacetylase/succinyl-diaminopimelate desuccinylase-like protein
MDTDTLQRRVSAFWDERILPALTEFIRIPNESPAFDKDWREHGHMERAVSLAAEWVAAQGLAGCSVEVLRQEGRTPLLLVQVRGRGEGTALIYGHLDKQPPMTGWREGLGPWTPVQDGEGRLFGRGAADDGYAVFAATAALQALQAQAEAHPQVAMLIECSEESGSPDLSDYLDSARSRIGDPDLVLCLDSGCGDYRRLWCTTSLRGLITATITVGVLSEGVHSGMAGGIVPSPVRILRRLLDRLEDPDTGEIRPEAFRVPIPPLRVAQARLAAETLGPHIVKDFPFLEGVRPLSESVADLLVDSSWKASLAITAQEGIPALEQGGNVLLPQVKAKLSLRIPPTLEPGPASQALKALLETDPPHRAQVTVSGGGMAGWESPPLAPWLEEVWQAASRELFGEEARAFGAGGTIPFMQMIGSRFPQAQFLTTGVLGPHSNAHGPNEFLHVPYAKRLSCAIARVLQARALRKGRPG